MAFLLLLHEKMRLQRKVNQLTLKEARLSSRKERITKNIERVQKMYSSKISMIEKTTKAASTQFKSNILQQLQIGSEGLNPMAYNTMGGLSLFAQNAYGALATEYKNLGGMAAIQCIMANQYKRNDDNKIVLANNQEISQEEFEKLSTSINNIRQQEYSRSYVAQQMSAQYESNVSIWATAEQARLEAEQDEMLLPLQAEETDMDLDKESCEAQLADAKARLESIKQACSEGIKDSAPTFGLG